ncbi:type II toxin-antitoxin system Phd/YefM family antitoxin [Deinococcus sp. HMF7604]|uniref:type II toxin-antitoxin system Phd/YefM family antitoxin n=1 Tax=Deinococcus betulae TaxID=2873312 RepID=UPI001CCD2BEF|nr:type II toxin-antitoxin system Phd/YefM family antitoxin [Deinococcus betulae]MBZ9750932.1 type II toxin-antitoxin system Phd/YefM family antitoxin [Deinococcus betulae]
MTAYSLKFAKDNLERIAQETVQNSDETIITLDSGEAVVLIPLEQYEAWKETHHLLANPANRRHLLDSVEQYRQGRAIRKNLTDLQTDAPE